jgi:hypothetical protein
VLSDVLWALAVLGRPLPPFAQLQLLAYRMADAAWLESASLHMIARVSMGNRNGASRRRRAAACAGITGQGPQARCNPALNRGGIPRSLPPLGVPPPGQALWGLTKLQSMGDRPLLEPDGAEWRRVCTAFLDRAAESDAQDAGALEMFTEALALLSSEAGSCAPAGSPQCLSDKQARKYLKKACFTLG